MKKNKIAFLTVFAVLTTITLIIWIAFSAFFKSKTTELTTMPPKVLLPLSPVLDQTTLGLIQKRKMFSEEEISIYAKNKGLTESSEASSPATISGE